MSSINGALDPLFDPSVAAASSVVGSNDLAQSGSMSDFTDVIRLLNSFLRGELAAAETYRMAIEKMSKDHTADEVESLDIVQEDHARAARLLADRIHCLNGMPSESAGIWGAWTKFTMGTARLFGDLTALKSLEEGEEHGLKEYHAGLDQLDHESLELVQNKLIPAQSQHIQLLDSLISAIQR